VAEVSVVRSASESPAVGQADHVGNPWRVRDREPALSCLEGSGRCGDPCKQRDLDDQDDRLSRSSLSGWVSHLLREPDGRSAVPVRVGSCLLIYSYAPRTKDPFRSRGGGREYRRHPGRPSDRDEAASSLLSAGPFPKSTSGRTENP
jgi:hypothetical protein